MAIQFPREVCESWLRENLGEPKVDSNKDEWRYNEFLVDDSQRKLYVNVAKCRYVGFKSGDGGPFEKLVAKYNSWPIQKAVDHLLNKHFSSIVITDSLRNEIEKEVEQSKKLQRQRKAWSILPEESSKVTSGERYSAPYINYLRKRKIPEEFIFSCYYSYATSYNDTELPLKDYVILPYYDAYGIIEYWTARDITGRHMNKYLNCVEADAGEFVYNIRTSASDVVICEGVLDAAKFGEQGIAMGGKNYSISQIDQVVNAGFDTVIIGGNREEFNKGPKKAIYLLKALKLRGQNAYIFDWHSFCEKYRIDAKDFGDIGWKKNLTIKDIDGFLIKSEFEAAVKFKIGSSV